MAQTIGEIVTKLTADIGDHKAKLKQAQDQIRRLEGEAKRAQTGFSRMGGSIAKFAAGFATAAVAMRGLRVVTRKMVTDTVALDSAMGQVATLTDKTGASFDLLTKRIKSMSTSIPKTADDLGMGLYQTLSSGITDTAEAMQVLEASASLAASGLIDTQTSVDAVTTVMNAYGLSARNVTEVTDSFFQTVKQGKITVGGLAAAIGTAATSASLAGVTVDDLGAAIATMTKLGIDANTTTTSLNRLFLGIVDATDETRKAAEALGIEWSTAGLKAKGLSGFMQEVADATKGDIDALTALGLDLRAARSLFILAGSGAQEFANIQEEMARKAGSTAQALRETNATMKAQWQLIKNQLGVSLTDLGGKIIPPVIAALGSLARALEDPFDRAIRLMREAGDESARVSRAIRRREAAELRQSQRELERELTKRGFTLDVDIDMKGVEDEIDANIREIDRLDAKLTELSEGENTVTIGVDAGLGAGQTAVQKINAELAKLERSNQTLFETAELLDNLKSVRLELFDRSPTGQLKAFARAMGGMANVFPEVEEGAKDVGRAINLAGLSYEQLIALQGQLASTVASTNVAMAIERDNEKWGKLNETLAEAEHIAGKVKAALADMPVPQIDFGALSADEFWEWYAQLQQDLKDNALELKLTVDGSEARAEAERIRAELEAQRDAARAEMLRPGAGVTGPVALEADVNITGALEKFLGVEGLSTEEAQAKLDGLAESLGRALPAMTDVVGSLLVFDERIGQFVPAIDMSGVEERFAGLAEQLKQHAVVTRQIPNYWRTSLVQTDRVQDKYRAGLVTVTRRLNQLGDAADDASKPGFFGGLKERLFGAKDEETGPRAGGILDPKEFASNFAAGLATGFVTMAASKLGDALSGFATSLFGGSEFKRHTEANTRALDNLSDRVRELGEALLSSPIGSVGKAVDAALARFQVEFPQFTDNLTDPTAGGPGRAAEAREALFEILDDELRRLGLSMSDVEELARSLGMEWKGWTTDLATLQALINELDWTAVFDTASGKLSLLKREWDLFDMTPEQKMASLKDYVASNLTGDLKAAFDAVDWGDLDSVTAFWNAFTTGKFKAEDLNIPVDVFMDTVGQIENLADATDAAADGVNKFGDALRNVPSGFKVALRRFQADTGEMAKDAFSNLGGPETKPRTDLEGSVPGEPIVLKAADSFASAVDTFSMAVGDTLTNELEPALQEFIAALKNPLTGVSVEVDADGLAQTINERLAEAADAMRVAVPDAEVPVVDTARFVAALDVLADAMGVTPDAPDVAPVQDALAAFSTALVNYTLPVPVMQADGLTLLGDAALRAADMLSLLTDGVEATMPGGTFGQLGTTPDMLPATQGVPTAPPLGTGQDGTGIAQSGDNITIHQLTVVSNDPDDMLDKITTRAKQRSRLGGVTDLDLAVRPVGTRGTPSGVR